MKVLHVGEYVQGGVATYIHMLLNIKTNDIENYLVLSEYKSDNNWGLDSQHIKFYKYRRNIIYACIAMLVIIKHIDDIKPDIIYCHSTWAGVIVRFPLLFKSKRVYVIYNAHGWSFLRDTKEWKKRIYSWIERKLSKVTDCIINVSTYEYLAALKRGIPKEKNVIIYSGVPDKKEKVIIENDDQQINLLYVGRFDYQKGVDILLDSFNRCNRDDIHLTLIGKGIISDSGRINFKCKKNVTFLGWLPAEEVCKNYELCDAVVMPSRWEAFGLVAVEAMMHAKPVIASNRGALPELVADGETGWVFSLEDKNGLVKILSGMEKNEIKKRGKAARDVYEKKFTAKNMLIETLNIYSGKRRIEGK